MIELHNALNVTPDAQRPAEAPAILRLIHSPDDRVDRVDPEGMAITYRAVLELVQEIDGI